MQNRRFRTEYEMRRARIASVFTRGSRSGNEADEAARWIFGPNAGDPDVCIRSRPGQTALALEESSMNVRREATDKQRKVYVKPEVRSEQMFETSALACGKCLSGPVGQYQCGSLLQNS